MPKTQNAYVPDQGEVVITISADNVSSIAAFTTAEDIVIDGVVRRFERANDPSRAVETTRVTGDITPIATVSDSVGHEEWELEVVDDYYSGQAGEWGTDNLSAVEILKELFKARNLTSIGGLAATPAGGDAGDIETTLVNPEVLSVSKPKINADQTTPNTVVIRFSAESSSEAVHA